MPDRNERAELIIAGLHEKKIQLSLDVDTNEINSELYMQFPNCGGFELLKLHEGGGKRLNPIPVPPSRYSAVFFKSVIHNAKIYIRPVQQDLSLGELEVILYKLISNKTFFY